MPTVQQAKRAAVGVGAATTVIGGALAVAPQQIARRARLQDPTGLRTIGVADLALVPGLVAGRPRWPWMVARGALNIAIAAFLLRRPAGPDRLKQRIVSAALLGVTAQDLRVAAVLRRAEG
jgi:hypothetical protein